MNIEQKNYRKLNSEEIIQLAAKLKYVDLIDLKKLCDGVIKFFGATASKVKLIIGSEYNDQTYDLKISDIKVTDLKGKTLNYNEDHEDNYYDWKYDLIESQEAPEDLEVSNIVIDIKTGKIEKVPDLYVLE